MSMSRFFTLSTLIRVMILGGLVAMFVVIVQSCQSPEYGLMQYSKGDLKRLEVKEAPPAQSPLTFTGENGAEMTLKDYRGKLVLLNVWATWCAPCIIEMPMLNDLQGRRGGDDFQVVTISVDRIKEEPAAFMAENNLTHLTPWHDGSFSLPAKVGARGLPISIFYDKKGREVARISGEVDWTGKDAQALIDILLQ